MEVQWIDTGDPKKGFIIYMICRECRSYYKLVPTDYMLVISTKNIERLGVPILFRKTGPHSIKKVGRCPGCNYPITPVKYVVRKRPGKAGVFLGKDMTSPLSMRVLNMATEVIKGRGIYGVGDEFGITGPAVSHQTRRVFERLMPITWETLKRKTKANVPIIEDMRFHKKAFFINLRNYLNNRR